MEVEFTRHALNRTAERHPRKLHNRLPVAEIARVAEHAVVGTDFNVQKYGMVFVCVRLPRKAVVKTVLGSGMKTKKRRAV